MAPQVPTWVKIDTGLDRRFIPACAGNSLFGSYLYGLFPVHPRVCGEQGVALRMSWTVSGSSPRVRGTVDATGDRGLEGRFIPACAGNSADFDYYTTVSPVHPRVCGEQICSIVIVTVGDGSSPRVRGTVVYISAALIAARFIPACARNS